MEKIKCEFCEGLGYTAEHDPFDPHEGGQCSNCPIQFQCEKCLGTGFAAPPIKEEEPAQSKDTFDWFHNEQGDITLTHNDEPFAFVKTKKVATSVIKKFIDFEKEVATSERDKAITDCIDEINKGASVELDPIFQVLVSSLSKKLENLKFNPTIK